MRSYWIRLALESNKCFYNVQKWTHRDAEKRWYKDGGREWRDMFTRQGSTRIALSHQGQGEGHGAVSPSEPLEGTKPLKEATKLFLDVWLLGVWENFCVASHPVCGNPLWQSQEMNTLLFLYFLTSSPVSAQPTLSLFLLCFHSAQKVLL